MEVTSGRKAAPSGSPRGVERLEAVVKAFCPSFFSEVIRRQVIQSRMRSRGAMSPFLIDQGILCLDSLAKKPSLFFLERVNV
jgi:hypothetical protein